MGKTHKKIVMAGVCCLMISMLTGCGNDTTKITEGMQLVETLDYQGALTAFDEAEAQPSYCKRPGDCQHGADRI